MALKYGIFPARLLGFDDDGLPAYDDRAVDEEYFRRYHAELVQNGISATTLTSFQVRANSGMSVSLYPGSIFINGYFAYDEENTIITLPDANPYLSRVDRIVARLNVPDRSITITHLEGMIGTTTAPALTRTTDIYEMSLATIDVGKGVTAITQSSITDTRFNSDLCGVVSGYLGKLNLTDINAQYSAAFKEWFEGVKGQLDGDAAGNLQNQINTIDDTIATLAPKTELEAIRPSLVHTASDPTYYSTYLKLTVSGFSSNVFNADLVGYTFKVYFPSAIAGSSIIRIFKSLSTYCQFALDKTYYFAAGSYAEFYITSSTNAIVINEAGPMYWRRFSFPSSVTLETSTNYGDVAPAYAMRGNRVYLRGLIRGLPDASTDLFGFTIQYRPTGIRTIPLVAFYNSISVSASLSIRPTGIMRIFRPGNVAAGSTWNELWLDGSYTVS